jgi:hypothetical protein
MVVVKHLVWEDGNTQHIARHDVTTNEVEEVCRGTHIALDGKAGRLLIVGLTKKGRLVTAVLDPEPEAHVYYTVTARSADKKERRRFRQEKGGAYEKTG